MKYATTKQIKKMQERGVTSSKEQLKKLSRKEASFIVRWVCYPKYRENYVNKLNSLGKDGEKIAQKKLSKVSFDKKEVNKKYYTREEVEDIIADVIRKYRN